MPEALNISRFGMNPEHFAEGRVPQAAASARDWHMHRVQAPRSLTVHHCHEASAVDVSFGIEVLPRPRKVKLEHFLRPQHLGRDIPTKEANCFGAAQLTVEADERLGFWPAGRAGYIRARRTASRRLQTLPPKKLR